MSVTLPVSMTCFNLWRFDATSRAGDFPSSASAALPSLPRGILITSRTSVSPGRDPGPLLRSCCSLAHVLDLERVRDSPPEPFLTHDRALAMADGLFSPTGVSLWDEAEEKA